MMRSFQTNRRFLFKKQTEKECVSDHPWRKTVDNNEWANTLVKQLWPKCQTHLRQLLQQVEDDRKMKERLRGYNIKSVRFVSVSLGEVAPTLTGLKVASSKPGSLDEIVLEVSGVHYAGDMTITTEIELDSETWGRSAY